MIYADFENVLVLEVNGKQSPEESKHIIYLDANNLYSYAMSKFPATTGFKWIDPKEFDLNKYKLVI